MAYSAYNWLTLWANMLIINIACFKAESFGIVATSGRQSV